MSQERPSRDWLELALVAIMAGGAALAGIAAPQFLRYAGHTGAEYVGLGAQILGPLIFGGAALTAFLVYLAGGKRMPHALLAVITALIVGGLAYVPTVTIVGLISVIMTSEGVLVAVPVVFIALSAAVAVYRRRRARRTSSATSASSVSSATSASAWRPPSRMRFGAAVFLAALAAGLPPAAMMLRRAEVFGGDSPLPAGDVSFFAFLAAVPNVLLAAWTVAVVLILDQGVARRAVRAVAVGVATAVVLGVPTVALSGGFDGALEWAIAGLVSGLLAAIVVFIADGPPARRVDEPVVESA